MTILIFALYLLFSWVAVVWAMPALIIEIVSVACLFSATFITGLSWFIAWILWIAVLAMISVRHISSLRSYISTMAYNKIKIMIPSLSSTESEALDAGDTWLEQDIFLSLIHI